MLPYVERTQKISDVFFYQGLLVAFKKVTLLASQESEALSQQIAIDLNPDLMKPLTEGFVAILAEKIKTNYHSNTLMRHVVLVDILLAIITIFNLACGWIEMNDFIKVVIVIIVCDLISTLAEMTESDKPTSLNG